MTTAIVSVVAFMVGVWVGYLLTHTARWIVAGIRIIDALKMAVREMENESRDMKRFAKENMK